MDRDPTPHPLAAPASDPFAPPAVEGDDRRCARCRLVFEDMPTLDIKGRTRRDWSLCPTCEPLAFPKRSPSSATLTVVRPEPSDQDRRDHS